MARLLNASQLDVGTHERHLPGTPIAVTALGRLLLRIHVDQAAERSRLDKEIDRVEAELRTVETKLANKSFVERAPAAIVGEHRQRQKNFAAQLAKLKQAREAMG